MLPPSTDMWNGLACPSEHPASPFAYASPHGCLAHLFIVLLTFIRAFYSREKRNKSFDVTIPLLPLLLLVFVCHHHGGGYRGLYQLWTTDCPPSHGAFFTSPTSRALLSAALTVTLHRICDCIPPMRAPGDRGHLERRFASLPDSYLHFFFWDFFSLFLFSLRLLSSYFIKDFLLPLGTRLLHVTWIRYKA
ncbi:hypothetical protein CI102_9287 [Trichoderma harzianum]|uniref:Uncharacterized protein n=1 Tax=Trichoderma harzianum CBS 226.95 TaxID=983964 RepID=A0A2T4AI47_TRIHA|nr:hypothetical protein M431DRAFT_385478 [Trichoderma harzianum CBS 226.95]PKK45447.1 hypothetical protein CI102_9287 [Trichoderma harzianum]PTB56726.1 hypothetical protein M431DRAFT_385478 [Trichoderma harzianum CBS 226.95]